MNESFMEIKDIIYSAGILLTFGLGAWNLIVNYKTTRKTSFINTVTSQRIKWLEQLRLDIGAYCGLTHNWFYSGLAGTEKEHEVLKEIDRLRHVIQLRLNPNGALDQKIQKLIQDIPNFTDQSKKQELDKAIQELVERSQEMLKEEWEKVKAESVNGNLNEEKKSCLPWKS
ncbi:MAG TPA: hypothetical protein PL131_04510 [Methylotenera sp.]|nr:hypothetical protein [Methylotenera sp.]HPH05116.1 hypothetical protein [Methylotenera sp.]HPN00480.1 hypothetical protein [Methylotenera sp.]